MILINSFKMALMSIYTHKLRSILTIIGIVIGVSSIITIIFIGQSGTQVLKTQIVGSGNNSFEITYNPKDDVELFESNSDKLSLNQEQLNLITETPGVLNAIPSSQFIEPVNYYNTNVLTQINGITLDFFNLNKNPLIEGRLLNKQDILKRNRVAIINEDFASEFFNSKNPIGEFVEVNGVYIEVVGIIDDSLIGLTLPKLFTPLEILSLVFNTDEIHSIKIQVDSPENIELIGKSVIDKLNNATSLDGTFEVFNLQELADGLSVITNIMTILIVCIASITLLVGGIGIMNIMLVSVTERTKEIGIRKSLGATKRNIVTQFVTESIVLTFIGGVIGVIFGVGLTWLISYMIGWPYFISPYIIFGALVFCVLLGIIFGILPANRAAKLNPIEALKHE